MCQSPQLVRQSVPAHQQTRGVNGNVAWHGMHQTMRLLNAHNAQQCLDPREERQERERGVSLSQVRQGRAWGLHTRAHACVAHGTGRMHGSTPFHAGPNACSLRGAHVIKATHTVRRDKTTRKQIRNARRIGRRATSSSLACRASAVTGVVSAILRRFCFVVLVVCVLKQTWEERKSPRSGYLTAHRDVGITAQEILKMWPPASTGIDFVAERSKAQD